MSDDVEDAQPSKARRQRLTGYVFVGIAAVYVLFAIVVLFVLQYPIAVAVGPAPVVAIFLFWGYWTLRETRTGRQAKIGSANDDYRNAGYKAYMLSLPVFVIELSYGFVPEEYVRLFFVFVLLTTFVVVYVSRAIRNGRA